MTTFATGIEHSASATRWPTLGSDWQPDAAARLDHAHLAAWCCDKADRTAFASGLSAFLAAQPATQVVTIHGRSALDLESFCTQLERSLAGPPLRRAVDGPGGIASILRWREPAGPTRPIRHRYYLWHDCDELILHDAALFGRLAEVILGVAAEAEYASEDLLLIHRAVFLGGSALAVYHEDPNAQFQRWAPEIANEPFWQAISGVQAPVVAGVDLADLAEGWFAEPVLR